MYGTIVKTNQRINKSGFECAHPYAQPPQPPELGRGESAHHQINESTNQRINK